MAFCAVAGIVKPAARNKATSDTVASGVWALQPFDIDGDGVVGITDLLMLLAAWGPCPAPCPSSCAADLDADCNVGISDFLLLLANWT